VERLKKIDIHCHALEEKIIKGPYGSFPDVDDMRKAYDVMGVEKAVLLPLVDNAGCPQSQSVPEVLRIVRERPDTIGWWFCNFDPGFECNDPDVDISFYLKQYKALGAKGVGELTKNIYFDDQMMLNLFKHCEACQMPVLFHIGQMGRDYGVADEMGLPRLEKVLKMFPNLIFIGHSTKFWNEISGDCYLKARGQYHLGPVTEGGRVVELMRKYKNLHCDMSAGSGYFALTRDPEFTYKFIEEFQDRIYYGADICTPDPYDRPLMKLPEFLDEAMEQGKISYDAYRKVCRDNALRLLEGE